jgi:hypothetical protein
MKVYLDWDCTLTQSHQYHALRSSLKLPSELSALWQESADRERKEKGFTDLVMRLSPQYALWGRKGEQNHKELAKLTQGSTALIDLENPNEALVYDDMQRFLFGDEQRRIALDKFIRARCERDGLVCILTRGLTGTVYSAISSFFESWLKLPIDIVDHAGQCLTLNTMEFKFLNTRNQGKLQQIVEMEYGYDEATLCSRVVSLVDDSFEEEVERGQLGKPLIKSNMFQFYATELSDGEGRLLKLSIGGTKRNGNGLQIPDFAYLQEYFASI